VEPPRNLRSLRSHTHPPSLRVTRAWCDWPLWRRRRGNRLWPWIWSAWHFRGGRPERDGAELAQILEVSQEVDAERGREALADLADFPLRRYPHDFLLPRVWELRNNLTAYDAVYVALAEALGAPLLTRDRRIAAAPGHDAQVELV